MRKPYAVYAITKHGISISQQLMPALPGADLFVSEKLFALAPPLSLRMPLPMGPTLTDAFAAYDCHIFIISVGAVVRMVAPLMKNKKVDPAVICVDDAARFSICVLSGHVGRGNVFTERVAKALGAQSVVTTASDAISTLTVDILGRDLGWTLDDPDRNVTSGCAAVVNAMKVAFIQETGEPSFWPEEKALPPGVEYFSAIESVDPTAYDMLLIVSDRDLKTSDRLHFDKAVVYRPKSLVLGIGCDRETPFELIERGVKKLLAENGLVPSSVKALASIDKKHDEFAFLRLCEVYGWEFKLFQAAELDAVVEIETPSDMVKKHMGTRGVAEPAALLASGASKLLMPKKIYTEEGAGKSMTLAIARVPFRRRVQVGPSTRDPVHV